jgi:hypothetical protein
VLLIWGFVDRERPSVSCIVCLWCCMGDIFPSP